MQLIKSYPQTSHSQSTLTYSKNVNEIKSTSFLPKSKEQKTDKSISKPNKVIRKPLFEEVQSHTKSYSQSSKQQKNKSSIVKELFSTEKHMTSMQPATPIYSKYNNEIKSTSFLPKSKDQIPDGSISKPNEYLGIEKMDREFQQHMNRNIAFLKVEIRNIQNNQLVILERLDSIQSHLEDQPLIDKTNSSINELANYQFPIDNVVDLYTFEDNISGDQQFRTHLVKELSYIGGKHTKAMVQRIMSKLFKDELLKNYSFTGKKGKTPFSSLAICSVIFEAVKKQIKFKNVPQNEIEETIKYILAQAPFNLKRSTSKMDKQSSSSAIMQSTT
ncbi:uncharacterized protein LOC112681026 [Sipha flava]|uniref:Uncharacterized protein LOC112681026 n=1 Tax=Sipha flava TaxID=143950 RepID=A0A8B8F9L7_9HEMI|nr:uncharacterized protein LOC112681026 [Sipha flava]